MEFTINQSVLVEGLKAVKGLVAKPGSSNPLLTGILIEADNKEIKLTAGNGNNFITYGIDIKDHEDCSITKPGAVVWHKTVTDIVNKYKDATLSFSKNEKDFTTIKSGADEFEMAGFNATEYPTLADYDSQNAYTLPGDVFQKLIKRTAFAASESDTRPILSGVQFEFQEEGTLCTCTDSHRMARVKASTTNSNEQSIVVKAENVKEMAKVFDVTKEIECFLEQDNLLIAKSDNVVFYVRLLEGNYPDVSKLIPQEFPSRITLNRNDLLQAVDKVNILSKTSGSATAIRFELDEKSADLFSVGDEGTNNVVSLSVAQQDVGKGNANIRVSGLEGDTVETFAFNGRFLQDALQAMESTEVMICIQGPMKPFLIIPKHETDERKMEEIQLILPVRLY
ncbi:DNA polymerase III subunit beta [Pontibacillus halophilus]|uniref:DNA polymerase III subunit beta n=1 Tax=Pontibacillus halophilus TaxID=516704 RepID=UPI00041426D6|nr:DNA polymerase III subunit beta [Pontibacillus halophilus]